MYLEEEKINKFYELLYSLLDYTNNKYKINKKLFNKLNGKNSIDVEEILKIRERLWKDNSIIEEYIKENPKNLQEKDLQIIESWKNRVADRFIMVKQQKKYTMLMNAKNVYGILGISNEISDIIPTYELPTYIQTVLLPFEDVIIYDSIIFPYMIRIGSGLKKIINEDYMEEIIKLYIH